MVRSARSTDPCRAVRAFIARLSCQTGIRGAVAAWFRTNRRFSLRDRHAARRSPQDEASDPHGEERGNAAHVSNHEAPGARSPRLVVWI